MENRNRRKPFSGDFLSGVKIEDKSGFNRKPATYNARPAERRREESREGGRPYGNSSRPQRSFSGGSSAPRRPFNGGARPGGSSENRFNRSGDNRSSGGFRGRSFGGGFRGERSGGFRSGPTSYSNGRAYGRSGGGGRGRPRGKIIDRSLFINKAVIKEVGEAYVPKYTFADFKIDPKLEKNVEYKKFTMPTPIQDQAIPHILRGADVVGLASTGTGKTGAFLIPTINKIIHNPNHKVLVIAPTRELATQINDDLKSLTPFLGIWSELVIGGANMQKQMQGLRRKHSYVIGTPGRLKDMIERNMIRPSEFGTLILDEVDRMLDMGFIDDIKFIVEKMPKDRQTLFFSATLSREIEGLINQFLKTPVRIEIKSRATSENVEQDIVELKGRAKLEVLEDILRAEEAKRVLIFVKTKRGADQLEMRLNDHGFKVRSIHGDKTQFRRQTALDHFKFGKANILVATDVAARGLDIKDISHVINYDVPENYDDYIHRIGRTGRADKKGIALTFVD